MNKAIFVALNLLKHIKDKPISLHVLAPKVHTTVGHLYNITTILRDKGLIQMKIGHTGGACRTPNSSKLTVWDVYRAFGGLQPISDNDNLFGTHVQNMLETYLKSLILDDYADTN